METSWVVSESVSSCLTRVSEQPRPCVVSHADNFYKEEQAETHNPVFACSNGGIKHTDTHQRTAYGKTRWCPENEKRRAAARAVMRLR